MAPHRTTKKWIAKCKQNQAALDRLVEHRETKDLKDRYAMTLKRAMESLQATTDVIETYQQAKALKYVGDHIASLICPPQKRSTPSSPASSVASSSNGVQKQQRNNKTNATAKRNLNNLATIPEVGKKQKIYNHAIKLASDETKWKQRAKYWRVVLLIDEREQQSRRMVAACEMSGIPCEVRTLPISDMGWIAQGLDENEQHVVCELMLGTLVERKTPDDLKASLFGTRYQEQRLRLKNSGIPQILFLIEGELRDLSRCPLDTLLSAIWETRLHMDFQIVQTEDLTGTVRLLKRIHRRILQRSFPQAFAGSTPLPIFMEAASANEAPVRGQRRVQSLAEMTFDTAPVPCFGMKRFMTYMELKAKVERDREAGTKTVRSIHLAMLKQVPTFSNVKCEAIARVYPTPRALLSANLKVSEIANIPTKNPKESQKLATIGEKSARELILVYGNSFQLAPNPIRKETTTDDDAQDLQVDRPSSKPSAAASQPAAASLTDKASLKPAASCSRNYFSEKPSLSGDDPLRPSPKMDLGFTAAVSRRDSLPDRPSRDVDCSLSQESDQYQAQDRTVEKRHTEAPTSPFNFGSSPDLTVAAATRHMLDSDSSDGEPLFIPKPTKYPTSTTHISSANGYSAATIGTPKQSTPPSSPDEDDLLFVIERSKKDKSPEEKDLELAIQRSLQDQQQDPQQSKKKRRRMLNTSLGSLFDESSDEDAMPNYFSKRPSSNAIQEVIEID